MNLIAVDREHVPPVCVPSNIRNDNTLKLAKDLYERFGSNNFTLQSHLESYAYGIFPLASRLFNHSCVPTAVYKFVIKQGQPTRMEIIALRDIAVGEEVRPAPVKM